jgi:hypothetical protein
MTVLQDEEGLQAKEPIVKDMQLKPTLTGASVEEGELINASGHVQELEKNFSLWSLIALGITIGDVWPATAGRHNLSVLAQQHTKLTLREQELW